MAVVDDSHLTDDVIEMAFRGTNFGRTDFRTILAETVLKRASGYPKLGLTFAFHHYYKACVRDALTPRQE